MRRRIAVWLILATVIASFPDQTRAFNPVSQNSFSIWEWVLRQGSSKVYDRLTIKVPQETSTRAAILNDFFRTHNPQLIPQVEGIIAAEIEETLAAEGISFPPAIFKLGSPPTLLVLSPRAQIAMSEGILLNPALSDGQKEEIESYATKIKPTQSALVVDLGGFSLFPASVEIYSPRQTVKAAAHEWCHHYLSLFPLGWAFFGDARNINEITCGIVGEEVGTKIATKYGWSRPSNTNPAPENKPNLEQELKQTRVIVEGLLAQGKVEEAEALMESERVFLSQYYRIRKLNQAYFAFYGFYGGGAAGNDPTADQVGALRTKSSSLGSFLGEIRWVWSQEKFRELLGKEGIN